MAAVTMAANRNKVTGESDHEDNILVATLLGAFAAQEDNGAFDATGILVSSDSGVNDCAKQLLNRGVYVMRPAQLNRIHVAA